VDSREQELQATIDRLARELAASEAARKRWQERAEAAEQRAERLGKRWRRAAQIAFDAGRKDKP
jgi:hypothetical protein